MKTIIVLFVVLLPLSLHSAQAVEVAPDSAEYSVLSSSALVGECVDFQVLLDVSDHILDQRRREQDIAAVEQAWDLFYGLVSHKRFRRSCDRFRVSVAPQEGMNLTHFLDDLAADNATSITSVKRRKWFEEHRPRFSQALHQLYEAASQGPFPGANIWTWLKDSFVVRTHDGKGRPVNTYLIVISNGYQYAESLKRKIGRRTTYVQAHNLRNNPRWREQCGDCGFISIEKDLGSVAVMMSGIVPKPGAVNEFEILKHHWEKLFVQDMKARAFGFFRSTGTASGERELVRDFFQQQAAPSPSGTE